MVVISSPACITASVRQLLMRCPLTITVQAPHCPWSQPFFVPVSVRCSRSASSNVVRGSRSRACCRPLTVSVTFSFCIDTVSAVASASAGGEANASVAAPDVARKRRRDKRKRSRTPSTALPPTNAEVDSRLYPTHPVRPHEIAIATFTQFPCPCDKTNRNSPFYEEAVERWSPRRQTLKPDIEPRHVDVAEVPLAHKSAPLLRRLTTRFTRTRRGHSSLSYRRHQKLED